MGFTLGIVTSVDHTHYIPLSDGLSLPVAEWELNSRGFSQCSWSTLSLWQAPHACVSEGVSLHAPALPPGSGGCWGGCARLIVEVGQLSVVWILL